jgi:hypothetical protein
MDLEAALKEAKRELSVRERVYDDWILLGRLSREQAAHRIAAMKFIIENLESQLPRQTSLLGDK